MSHDNPLDVFKENLLEQTQKIRLTFFNGRFSIIPVPRY